jgi:branched-chain amino acid transport system substrate-binding protein
MQKQPCLLCACRALSICVAYIACFIFPIYLFAENPAPVRIGVITSLTGDFSFFGTEVRRGAEIALAKINQNENRKVALFFEDDKCLPAAAISAYQGLQQRGNIDMLVGPGCTGAILAVAPRATRDKKYMLALFDANKQVEAAGEYVYVIGFETEQEGFLVADRVWKKHKKVGIIFESDAWATVVKNAFLERYKSLGGEIVAEEIHNVSEKDYRDTIMKVASKKPDAIYMVPAYNGGMFLKQARAQGVRLPVYGPDTFGITDVVQIAGKAAEGTTYVNVALDENLGPARQFKEAYRKQHGEYPSTFFYAAMGYDAVNMAYQVAVNPKPRTEAFQELQLRDSALNAQPFGKDRASRIPLGLYQIEKGEFQRIRD